MGFWCFRANKRTATEMPRHRGLSWTPAAEHVKVLIVGTREVTGAALKPIVRWAAAGGDFVGVKMHDRSTSRVSAWGGRPCVGHAEHACHHAAADASSTSCPLTSV
jgi:hypothetical protein